MILSKKLEGLMRLGDEASGDHKAARRREEIKSINRICNVRVRWLCHLIHEEKDKHTFERLIKELEELLAIRRQGLRHAAGLTAQAPKYPRAA